jgi:hypothetical protein
MMPIDPKKPVTIESLLHLKRSERPHQEFWQQFDSELRAKQLAAIVGPKPWYRFGKIRGLGMALPASVGVAAAFGAAFLSVHEFRSASPQAVSPRVSNPMPAAVASIEAPAENISAKVVSTPETSISAPRSTAVLVAATSPTRQSIRPKNADANLGAGTLVVTTLSARPAFPDPFTGAVSVAAGTTETSMSLASAVATPAEWTQAAYVSRPAQSEPLARTLTPADERREALLSDPLPNSASAWTSANSSDPRDVSELSQERLAQAVRRFGVGGDRLLVRF